MSDSLRKGLGDQVSEKITPDSRKSYAQQASENLSSTADKVAGTVQPSTPPSSPFRTITLIILQNLPRNFDANKTIPTDSQKSTTQNLADSTRSNAGTAQNQGSSYLDSAKQTLGNAANTASETLGNVANSASETLGNAANTITGNAGTK
ncbi:uncharacterized protein BP5553_05837 [Venustampulla echinocandica]|uniref:Uncharacterized protein n=1 Tax=Venustampulla echinocandica TaxID=2656787 RepID=A0A370TLT4_9HELO|nr:uncharacterized protein BP5553_05837 [Venustampulla echinocandica]RDL36485.1 hypothetical protein BP5553_05837 [Venustampulla echinocandica]